MDTVLMPAATAVPIAIEFAPTAFAVKPMAIVLVPYAATDWAESPEEIEIPLALATDPGPIAKPVGSENPPRSEKPVDPSVTQEEICQSPPPVPTLVSPQVISNEPAFSITILAASILTSVISISPPATISALPSTVPPPPQIPPQSTVPSKTMRVTSPENSSVSRLVTCISSISPSMLIDPSPARICPPVS